MQTPDFYQAFIAPVENTGFDYFVTGAVAAILYGEPRLTHDIDLVINIPLSSIPVMTSLVDGAAGICHFAQADIF